MKNPVRMPDGGTGWFGPLPFCLFLLMTFHSFAQTTRYDYGKEPDRPFPKVLKNDGARHAWNPNICLGPATDFENDGIPPSASADGDDTHGSEDEDGVVSTSTLVSGSSATVNVTATVAGFLDAWIDFNRDGDWTGWGERIFSGTALGAGSNSLPGPGSNRTIPILSIPRRTCASS